MTEGDVTHKEVGMSKVVWRLMFVVTAIVALLGAAPLQAGELGQCTPVSFGPEGLALEISVPGVGSFFTPVMQDRYNSVTIDLPGSGAQVRATARLDGEFVELDVEALTRDGAGDLLNKQAAPTNVGSYSLPVQVAKAEGIVLDDLFPVQQTIELRVVSSSDLIAQGCCESGDTICCPDPGECVRCNDAATCCTKPAVE